jgi:pimeloyl-ACP methyl ester carboxylesterase
VNFSIHVPQPALDDLAERLSRVRWPSDEDNGEGLDLPFVRRLVTYWWRGYDWRTHEEALNRLSQIRVDIDGLRIHAVHVKGRGRHPMPLLLTHGWPSSFAEFSEVVPELAADGFDVVVPSLPGYGFSDPLPHGQAGRVTAVWVRLMESLGYPRFAAHGGDIGAFVTNRLAIEYPDRLVGIHTTFPVEPAVPDIDELSDEELAFLAQRRHDREARSGYAHMQRTRPLTLACGLSDAPAGLAAWILDKWRDWSDCDGDLSRRFTADQLLTVVSLYWLTGTIGSSFRFYRDWGLGGDPDMVTAHFPAGPPGVDTRPLLAGERIGVPAAVALFKARFPRPYVERAYTDLRRFTVMPRGGHFPAMEEPRLLVDDLRDFFHGLRD